MAHLGELLGTPDAFLDQLFEDLNLIKVDVAALHLDHICYRVAHLDQYHKLKSLFLPHGSLLSDNIIGGREISVFRLHSPYVYKHREISIVELPSPKPGSPYPLGYEHVEFVVPNTLEEFKSKHDWIDFDTKGYDKAINRDLRITLSAGAVKFHEHSLEYVIENLD